MNDNPGGRARAATSRLWGQTVAERKWMPMMVVVMMMLPRDCTSSSALFFHPGNDHDGEPDDAVLVRLMTMFMGMLSRNPSAHLLTTFQTMMMGNMMAVVANTLG